MHNSATTIYLLLIQTYLRIEIENTAASGAVFKRVGPFSSFGWCWLTDLLCLLLQSG